MQRHAAWGSWAPQTEKPRRKQAASPLNHVFLALEKERRLSPLPASAEGGPFCPWPCSPCEPSLALALAPLLTKCEPYAAQGGTSHRAVRKVGAREEVGRVCEQRGGEVPPKPAASSGNANVTFSFSCRLLISGCQVTAPAFHFHSLLGPAL